MKSPSGPEHRDHCELAPNLNGETVEMSKYEPLEEYLRSCSQSDVPMTFSEIEEIIGDGLPSSAFKHRPWWSNNPSNSVITYAWLRAGYKSAEVDMTGRKLVFRKSGPGLSPDPADDSKPVGDSLAAAEAQDGFDFSRVFGALKGMVTIKPGTDLTEPTGADWEAER